MFRTGAMTRVGMTGRCALCLAVVALLPFGAAAQMTTADIVGRVTDPSGAVVQAAAVSLEHAETGHVRQVVTGATGDYAFNLLPPGTYRISIDGRDFAVQARHVVVAAGDRLRVDVQLPLGALNENAIVTPGGSPIQTDSATISALVPATAVRDLPVPGRNFVRLVQLQPGASEGLPNSLASGTRPDDRRQTSAVSINGQRDNQNNHLIDGMDNNERAIGTIGVKPSIEAIAEVRIQTSLYSAEVGRTAGGVVNIVTKSGSNAFHGSAFEYLRHDRFDARNFFARPGPRPLLRQHQFGVSLGGPVSRNRTFFFGDYEGFRQKQGVTAVTTVPTAAMARGDFSEVDTVIYDPLTSPRTPFPGNVIPPERLDPIALRYVALYPRPTSGGRANNFTGTRTRTQGSATADARLDHRITPTQSAFARYSVNVVNTFTPGTLPQTGGIEPGGGSFPGPNETRAHAAQLNYLTIHGSTLVSEVRTGYLRVDIESRPLNYGRYLSRDFGLANANVDQLASGLTAMNPAGLQALGDAAFLPLLQIDDTYQLAVSLTKGRGSHNIKAGAAIIDRHFTVLQSSAPVGIYTFSAALTGDGSGSGGDALASFLLGYPSTVRRSHSLIHPHYRTIEPSVYVQDDWRATSRLTLNLGMRYDVFTPYTEADNQLANFDRAAAAIVVAGRNGVSRSAGVSTDYSNFAPRAGFAATLPGDVVLRGGAGLAFFPGNYMSQSLMKNPPFVSTYGPITSRGNAGGVPTIRLADGLPPAIPTNPAQPVGTILAVEQDFKSTRVRQVNLVVEKDAGGNVISAGYVGSRGANVAVVVGNINLAPAGPGPIQERRPFYGALPGVNAISLFSSQFASSYDALQLILRRRQRDGVSVTTHYTLGHATNTAPHPAAVSVLEQFDADIDVRHRWVLTASYELPVGRHLTGAAQAFLAGWQVNAVGFWQSGLPFTVTNASPRSNTGATVDRPNQTADPRLEEPTLARWFDTGAFEAQPLNSIGNTGRNTLRGPPQRRLDVSLFKDVPVRGARLQLRVECFNITNTPSFANPNAALGSSSFGTVTSTGNSIPRQLQFAAKLVF